MRWVVMVVVAVSGLEDEGSGFEEEGWPLVDSSRRTGA